MTDVKPLCATHREGIVKWSGGPDGWGPHNPIPKGVTTKLAEEQRAMIKGWCRDGRGCN